jgi:aspartyl protease family protein
LFFVGIALLIAVLLGLLIATDAGTLIGLTQVQFGQIIALSMVLVLIAGGMFGRRIRFGKIVGGALAWIAIFGVAMLAYSFRDDVQNLGTRLLGELAPGAATIQENGARVIFRRPLGGSFRVNARVNAHEVRFIFDTGATSVVLTRADAANAGIDIARLRYSITVQTANGEGLAAPVRLREIRIGNIVRTNIPAMVASEGALETSLLGMSFLSRLSSYTVSNNTLEFRD